MECVTFNQQCLTITATEDITLSEKIYDKTNSSNNSYIEINSCTINKNSLISISYCKNNTININTIINSYSIYCLDPYTLRIIYQILIDYINNTDQHNSEIDTKPKIFIEND